MSTTKIADIVAAIPYGDGSKRKYRNVGALLKIGNNDPSKGPGFMVVLDAWFNPAGLPIDDGGQVFLSCYHPKERTIPLEPVRQRPLSRTIPGDLDDDIPF